MTGGDPAYLPEWSADVVRRNAESAELRELGQELIARGIRELEDGGLQLTSEAYAAVKLRAERAATVSPVPKLPRTIVREMGGAVPRGAAAGRAQLTFDQLRLLREKVAIIQVIHAAVHAKIRRVCRRWDGQRHEVGWEVTHRDALRPDGRVPRGFEPVIRGFERFMEEPAVGRCSTLADFMVLVAEDYLTINRPVVAPLYSVADPQRIVGWEPVDGALILPLADWLAMSTFGAGWIERKVPTSQMERRALVEQIFQVSLNDMRWVMIRDGLPERFFRDHDLIVGQARTRTDIQWAGYNPSTVETAVELIAAFQGTFQYNANYFRDGFMPDFALLIKGNMAPEDMQRFMQQLQDAAQGVQRAHQPLVLPVPDGGSGIDKVDLKKTNAEMGFETWLSCLVALTCAVYREDPSSINAKPWAGGAGASLSEANRAQEIELARADGLQSLLGHLTDHLLTPMARRMHPDLVVRWHFGEMDPERDAKVYQIRTQVDLTPNEARVLRGMAPFPPYWPAKDLGTLTPAQRAAFDANPMNQLQTPQFMAAMQARQQPTPTDDGFGEPPAEPVAPAVAPAAPPAAPPPTSARPPAPTPLAKASRFAWPLEHP